MTPTEATKILYSIEGYYKKEITSNPLALGVWLQAFLPLTPNEGTAMAMLCIENYEWLPSPKTLREEFAAKNGTDLKKELRQAIAAYAQGDAKLIRQIPPAVREAIVAAGGSNKFCNAAEQQWEKLEKNYIAIRTETAQKVQLTALAGGKSKSLEVSK